MPKGWVTQAQLKFCAMQAVDIDEWMMKECIRHVGTLNEAMALILGAPKGELVTEAEIVLGLEKFSELSESHRFAWIVCLWHRMEVMERRLFNARLMGRSHLKLQGKNAIKGSIASEIQFKETVVGGIDGLATPGIQVVVRAVLMYVESLGRGKMGYKFTLGLLGDLGWVSCIMLDFVMNVDGSVMEGITSTEWQMLNAWIKQNTLERFGPVRSVLVKQVFEVVCTGVVPSGRHKAGIKVFSAQILAWRASDSLDEVTPLSEVTGKLLR